MRFSHRTGSKREYSGNGIIKTWLAMVFLNLTSSEEELCEGEKQEVAIVPNSPRALCCPGERLASAAASYLGRAAGS